MAQSGACASVRGRNNVPIKTNLEPSLLSRLPGSKLTTPNQAWYLLLLSRDNRSAASPNPAQCEIKNELRQRRCSFRVRSGYNFKLFDMIFPWWRVVTKGHRRFPTLVPVTSFDWMPPNAKLPEPPNHTPVVSSLFSNGLLYLFFLAYAAGECKRIKETGVRRGTVHFLNKWMCAGHCCY